MSFINSPLLGVDAVLSAVTSGTPPPRTAFDQFSLINCVGIITGAHRGIGLEAALTLAEAGAIVYCFDLPAEPGADWLAVQKYVAGLPELKSGGQQGKGRLEYVSANVTDQESMWAKVEAIGAKEGRMDFCHANAGILNGAECLDYPAEQFRNLIDINVTGVLITAQAAGRQMAKFGNGGSIILTASMSGSMTNQDQHWTAYNTSKAAVIQMARSLACELGVKGIRVNSLSPGYIYTKMTQAFLNPRPELLKKWTSQNPLGRLGRTDELRGVILWLASDASTFCTGSDIIVDGGHRAW